MIVEKGSFNISNSIQWSQYVIGTGQLNRTYSQLSMTSIDIFNFNFPSTCIIGGLAAQSCAYPATVDALTLGAIATLQTFVHQTYMLLRTSRIRRRDITMVLTPHDSTTSSYSRFVAKETAAYMVFMLRSFSCVEGFAFETKRLSSVTSNKISLPFSLSYRRAPGIFGHLLSQNSIVDSTGLRAFGRNATIAYVITQEDWCDGPDPIHTTVEFASLFLVGELTTIGTTTCGVIYDGFITSSPTMAPSKNPTFPSSSPTLSPSKNPTFIPTASPTIIPSLFPSVSPSTSRSPTNRPTSKGAVIDMSTGLSLPNGKYWLEVGFVNINDQIWTSVASVGTTFTDAVIFTSLPDIGGSLYTQGVPTSTRIRNVISSGTVSFQLKVSFYFSSFPLLFLIYISVSVPVLVR